MYLSLLLDIVYFQDSDLMVCCSQTFGHIIFLKLSCFVVFVCLFVSAKDINCNDY